MQRKQRSIGQPSRNPILRAINAKGARGAKDANADPNSRFIAQRRRGSEELSMCDAAGLKRIPAMWKFQISDSDLDPFLAKNAKSAKELGRFSRGFHLRPSATSAVEYPELSRHGKCDFRPAQ
jgi:hypothetical protein